MDEQPHATGGRPPTIEEVFQPWELAGVSRRDCESHRGRLLFWTGRISLLAGGLSFAFPPAGIVGLVLGLVVRRTARRDLDRITAGNVDHRGYRPTEKALVEATCGAIVNALGCVFWLILLAPLILYAFLFLPFQ